MGGAKFDDTKVPMHLLSTPALFGIAEVLGFGAKKYNAWNWSKGIVYSRLFGGIMRHMWAWWWGEDNDPESGLNHLKHAMCGMMFLLTFVMGECQNLDDRPDVKHINWYAQKEQTMYDEWIKED